VAKRGRQSLAEMEIATLAAPVIQAGRVEAPAHMSDAERMVWIEVVNDQPADAFTDTHKPLLEMYCRHVVQARVIADQILSFNHAWLNNDDGLRRYDKLLAMQEREGRAASSLATRLRITRQAVDQQTIARGLLNGKKSRKPWELTHEGD
jgi:hypothetical protein